jgi:hypothetical protein
MVAGNLTPTSTSIGYTAGRNTGIRTLVSEFGIDYRQKYPA